MEYQLTLWSIALVVSIVLCATAGDDKVIRYGGGAAVLLSAAAIVAVLTLK